MEANVHGKTITLTPKSAIDRELALALEDIRQGRMYGPFASVDEMIHSLNSGARKGRKKRARKPPAAT